MFEIVQHDHAAELIALSGAYLEQRESENNLPYGLVRTLATDPHYFGPEPPLLLSALEHSEPVGVAVRTPPHRIVLSRFDTALELAMGHLACFLQTLDYRVPGVVGPEHEARCFADQWQSKSPGMTAKVSTRLRVFEARRVVDVPISPGRLRHAEPDDLPLMTQWVGDFSETAIGAESDPVKARANAEKYTAERKLYIWDHNGPVSIARESRALENGTVISLVYTPPELRNRGYATSCVYALTKRLLSGGHSFCSLYTDLSNPTSNHIYPKVGYVPLGDSLENYDFVPEDGRSVCC